MTVISTTEMIQRLSAEGFTLAKRRLDNLIAAGQIRSPRLVGPVRVWTPDDVAHVRRVLRGIDGAPAERGADD